MKVSVNRDPDNSDRYPDSSDMYKTSIHPMECQSMSWPTNHSIQYAAMQCTAIYRLPTSTRNARTASGLNRPDAIETKIAPLQNTVILRKTSYPSGHYHYPRVIFNSA